MRYKALLATMLILMICISGSCPPAFAQEMPPPPVETASQDAPPPPLEDAPPPAEEALPSEMASTTASTSDPVAMIQKIEQELSAVQGENPALQGGELDSCRNELKERLVKCPDEECKKASWDEFRACSAAVTKTQLLDKRNRVLAEAENLSAQATHTDACLMIINLRPQCDNDQDCKERVWKVYQTCSDKFAEGTRETKTMIVSDADKKILEAEAQTLGAEDAKAKAELEAKLAQDAQASEVARRQAIEAEKLALEKRSQELLERQRQAQKLLEVKPVVVPIEVKPSLAPMNTQTPYAVAPFNDCQSQFISRVKESQRMYQLNPIPRFDNAYVNQVNEALEGMRKCYAERNLGAVQAPTSLDILTEFGRPITSPEQCDEVIVGDLAARCDKNWACRQEAHLKAWSCKAVTSAVQAAIQNNP